MFLYFLGLSFGLLSRVVSNCFHFSPDFQVAPSLRFLVSASNMIWIFHKYLLVPPVRWFVISANLLITSLLGILNFRSITCLNPRTFTESQYSISEISENPRTWLWERRFRLFEKRSFQRKNRRLVSSKFGALNLLCNTEKPRSENWEFWLFFQTKNQVQNV
jgi:hypothetical protein